MKIKLTLFVLIINICFALQAQIQPTGCYSSSGTYQPCGSTWTDFYQGINHNCKCDCNVIPPAVCTPITSGGSGSSGEGGNIPGQINPGDVSSGNIMEGKAPFITHQSEAFTAWAESYRQMLASYGIISILGNNFTFFKFPATGDIDWDKRYKNKCDSFNPKTIQPVDKPLTVQLLTNTTEQAERDKWYSDRIKDQGFSNLVSVSQGGIDPAKTPSWDENSIENKAFNQMVSQIEGHPLGKLPAYLANTISGIGKEVMTYLDGVAAALGNGTIDQYASEHPNPEQEAVATVFGNQASSQVNSFVENASSEMVTTGAETIMNNAAGSQGVADFHATMGVISSIQETSDNINNAQSWFGALFGGNH